MNVKDELQDTTEKLRKQREELSVKMHLASMEVRDEWEEVEEKWEEFTAKSKQFYKEVEPSLGEIRTALSLLGSELEAGYQKIKSDSLLYLLLNLFSGLLLALYSYYYTAFAATFINVVWVIIAVPALFTYFNKEKK